MGWGKKKKKPSAADDAAAAGGRLESAEEPAVVDASASANDAASRSSSKKSSSSSSGGAGASKARTKGAKLLRASEIGEALAVLEEGLDESPHDSVALHALIARCHVANQDWEAATDHFVAALDDAGDAMNLDASNRNSNNPLDAEFFYAMGDAAFRRGMHPECAFAYESALEFGEKRIPKSVSISLVHFHLGATRRALGDHDAARESFAKVTNPLEVSLARADLKCEEAACFEAMGLVEEAERCVREAGEDPSGPPVKAENVSKVAWARWRDNPDSSDAEARAIEDLTACLAKRPPMRAKDQAETHARLGAVYAKRKEYQSAEKHLGASCAKAPDNHHAWLQLGELYRETNRDEMAMRAFTKCAEIDERCGGAYRAMAQMFEKHGQTSRAMAMYDKMDPNDPRVLKRKDEILLKCALRLQRAFRGHKARKQNAFKGGGARQVARNYGERAPLRDPDGDKSVIGYGVRGGSLGARGGGETLTLERFDLGVTAFGSAIPLAREANFKWRTVSLQDKGPGKHKPRERKPLGSSFF